MYGVNKFNNGLVNRHFIKQVDERTKKIFWDFCQEERNDEEVYWTNANLLKKFRNSRILLLGGGPSTSRWLAEPSSWSAIAEYDYLWSMNKFFLNPTLYNLKVDLFSLGPEVKFEKKYKDSREHKLLYEYLERFNPCVAFELHHKWANDANKQQLEEVNSFYDNHRKFSFSTKWYSALGAGVRLMLLAGALGVRQVDYVGFDGASALISGQHSFEKEKKFLPSALRRFNHKQIGQVMAHEYRVFWNYIKRIYPNTKYESCI